MAMAARERVQALYQQQQHHHHQHHHQAVAPVQGNAWQQQHEQEAASFTVTVLRVETGKNLLCKVRGQERGKSRA